MPISQVLKALTFDMVVPVRTIHIQSGLHSQRASIPYYIEHLGLMFKGLGQSCPSLSSFFSMHSFSIAAVSTANLAYVLWSWYLQNPWGLHYILGFTFSASYNAFQYLLSGMLTLPFSGCLDWLLESLIPDSMITHSCIFCAWKMMCWRV